MTDMFFLREEMVCSSENNYERVFRGHFGFIIWLWLREYPQKRFSLRTVVYIPEIVELAG